LHWLQFVAAGNPHMMARLNAARASFTRKLAAAANAMCAYTAHFRPF
jgi:hypothetical protein